jgi:DNA polymerase-3 subunit epsilon
MTRYIVFDVETPNRYNNRISGIGICVVEGTQIVKEYFSLVKPEQPFDWFNTKLTGISEESVAGAPTFPQLWKQIEPLMNSGILVAHNASFDMWVLRKCLHDYGIVWKPRAKGLCTVHIGRKLKPGISHKLNDMCEYYGICLDHHRADSDSRACAEILLRYMDAGVQPEQFVRMYTMR